jgi:hypothetical protein
VSRIGSLSSIRAYFVAGGRYAKLGNDANISLDKEEVVR